MRDERGLALIVVLITTIIVMSIGAALVGLMNTDITHAGIHHAKARSYYLALTGLQQAKAAIFAASDPVTYTTTTSGVTGTYGGGSYTYWIDAGPATRCPAGLKTLEARGEVAYLARTISSRVLACGVPGVPSLAALFAVSLIEAQGATSRTFLAPAACVLTPPPPPCAPGAPRGPNIGSFKEINFNDPGLRINALSETGIETVTLREGTMEDYKLFGFSERPIYETNPAVDPTPWILSVFGDIVKAQPTTGPIANPCVPATLFACVTVQNGTNDVMSMAELRRDQNMKHTYMNGMPQQVLPRLCDPALPQADRRGCLDSEAFRLAAAGNTANATINANAGLVAKTDSAYSPADFDKIATYLAANCPAVACLQGTVYIDGSYTFTKNVNLGGNAGNVTLVIRGDLAVNLNFSLTNRHNLSTVAGRRTPGILVLGLANPMNGSTNICKGEQANGSGRLILCGGANQLLIADGLLYTADGLFVGSAATVDLIGGMYHDNRCNEAVPPVCTSNPSYGNDNATVVVRFDPLSFSVFKTGIAIVSWQQLK
jgi:hypothetical protein